MILPIITYGHSVLTTPGKEISPDYSQLVELIQNMWDTVDHADGVGLAAPQINLSIKLFVVDSVKTYPVLPDSTTAKQAQGIRKAFINPTILAYSKEKDIEDEGCLSIPGIYVPVERSVSITIKYVDEHFVEHTETYHGRTARMIQHEYDHVMGKLYLDYLSPLQKLRLQNRLKKIRKGKI